MIQKRTRIILGPLELLVEDNVLTGEEEVVVQEVVLVGLLLIVLLVEAPLELFEVLVEHVLLRYSLGGSLGSG